MRVLSVVGARPQFVKASVVSEALQEQGIQEVLVHTGQHYDDTMSATFFEELHLPTPIRDLGVGSGSHAQQTGSMLVRIEAALEDERPNYVLVYGDTNSTLAGALAAAKLHIPVAHVEAGLRSFNRRMPEEINRIVTDHVSDLLFAPTTTAVENLNREGVPGESVHLVGDVMYDAAIRFGEAAEQRSTKLADLGIAPGEYALATFHRAENTDDSTRLHIIVNALARFAALTMPVVLPIHPRTAKALSVLEGVDLGTVKMIPPVGYLDMAMLEKHAAVVVTDSGGVQKEAFFYGVPCVTLRTETEWVELVELGWNRLAPPTDAAVVGRALSEALDSSGEEAQPYGAGDAAKRIVDVLKTCAS
jgi:UDP-GlcNAc3NAcA epimerase